MKVEVLEDFRDKTVDLKIRKIGDVLEVGKERAVKLESLGLVIRINEPVQKET